MMIVIVATSAYGKYSYTHNRAMEERAKQLAGQVFDLLANHAALNMQDPGTYRDRGMMMGQIRDDVLRSEFSTKRRAKLWERVQKKVEFNSNVRAAVRQAPHGDIARMWEWTGPPKMLENGYSGSGKRESGRFRPSLGIEDSPSIGGKETHEAQKWDEGRPIY